MAARKVCKVHKVRKHGRGIRTTEYHMICGKGRQHLGPCEIVIGNLDAARRSAKEWTSISGDTYLIGDKNGHLIEEVEP